MYIHIDPSTGEVVYVGKGCNGRAWDVTRCRSQHKPHITWLKAQINAGFLPSDWVVIFKRGLSATDAYKEEKTYLHTYGTLKFNRQSGERQHQAKLTDTQAIEIYERVQKGEAHKDLAKEYKISRTSISMIATGKQWRATTAHIRNKYDK